MFQQEQDIAVRPDLDIADARQILDHRLIQFGIMFYPDKDAGAREALRVLKPGGTFAFNVWGSFETNPAIRIAHETISGFFESDPPSFLETMDAAEHAGTRPVVPPGPLEAGADAGRCPTGGGLYQRADCSRQNRRRFATGS